MFVSAAHDTIGAARPRPSDDKVNVWARTIRRWLRSAAADVGESIDSFAGRSAVRRSWRIRKAGPADFSVPGATWNRLERELDGILSDLYAEIGTDAFGDVSKEIGIAVDPDLREVITPGAREAVGKDVTAISTSSRNDLTEAVATAVNRGYSVEQLTAGVKGDSFSGLRGIVDRWQADNPVSTTIDRATLIAKTELANAYNIGTLDAYAVSGLVELVNVFDGASCGWTTHTDPDLANGKRVPIDEARAHPISHPNCQRAFGAVIAGAPPPGAPGAQKVPRPQVGPQPGVTSPIELNARAIQARAFREASDAEPEVTAALQALERQGIGRLEGIAYRLKADGDRTVEKILGDVAAGDDLAKAAKVNDALRYTFMHEPGSYYSSVAKVHDDLVAAGFQPVKWRNNWDNPLSHDINTAWRSPSGTRFELQFHTPESFHRKMVEGPDGLPASHAVYEDYRSLAPQDIAHRRELEDLLTRIWKGTEIPPGAFKPPAIYP